MPRAIWNDVVIAEAPAERVERVEGHVYFPPDSVKSEFMRASDTRTLSPGNGPANYFDVVVAGQTNPDAAWYYPTPKQATSPIKDYVAFWKGVTIEP